MARYWQECHSISYTAVLRAEGLAVWCALCGASSNARECQHGGAFVGCSAVLAIVPEHQLCCSVAPRTAGCLVYVLI